MCPTIADVQCLTGTVLSRNAFTPAVSLPVQLTAGSVMRYSVVC